MVFDLHWTLDLNRKWARLQLTVQERLRLYRKISKMLGNGLPLLRVLEELELRASHEGRKPNEAGAIVLADWRRVVQNGGMLAEGMQWWVPYTEQMIIMAGEQAGQLESALQSVTGVVTAGRKIRNAVVNGVFYPVALLAMVLVYLYLFGKNVIPQFTRIADPTGWHGAARSLYVMSVFVQHWMIYCVALLIAAIALLWYSMPNWRGRLRNHADRFPPYSAYRLVAGSGFLIALSSLQAAGLTVEKSLLRLSSAASPWLRERIDDVLFGVKSGLNLGWAMKNAGHRFPSTEIIDDLCVYSEYNGFSEALKTLANEWIEEGAEAIAAQMRLLNGLAIIAMTLVIAWLITGFFGIQQEIAAMTRSMH